MFLGGKKKIIFSCLIGFVLAAFFISFLFIAAVKISPALAQQGNFGLDQINSDLPNTNLLTVINRAIKIVLGLLGVIALGFIIYAGFIWMTAGGDAKKVQKAKDIIVNALIGMIIILFSYAIASFVIDKLGEATSINNGGGDNGGGDINILPSSQFRINGIETAHVLPGGNHQNIYRCSNIQTKFNYWVKKETVDAADSQGSLQIIKTADNSKTNGSWTTLSNAIVFKHPALWEVNTNYQAVFPKSISNTQTPPKFLLACEASGDCIETPTAFLWNFASGSENDTEAPTLVSAYPTADLSASNYPDQNVSMSPVIEVSFSEPVDATTIIQENTSPPHPLAANIIIQELSGQGGTVAETLNNNILEAEIKDQGFRLSLIDAKLLKAFTWYRITAQNIADLCNNSMAAPKVWEFMTNDKAPGVQSQYPSGEKICPNTPISVAFNTTMYNNQVSISISGNGNTLSATLPAPAIIAPVYAVSNSSGTFSIKDTAEIADNKFRVFEFIPNSPLSVDTEYTVSVTTDLKTGGSTILSKTWNFKVVSADACVCSPYISHLSPNQGPKGQCLTVFGYCFKGTGQEPATPSITFDNISSTIEGSGDNYLTTTLPNSFVKGDKPMAQVTAAYPTLGSLSSNLADFYVDSDETANGPCLWSLNPAKGHQDQAVKISGTRFGDIKGTGDGVEFYSNIEAITSSWNNTSINTTVPVGAIDGDVTVTTEEGESNGVPFDVNGGIGASCDGNINSNVCDPNNLSCDAGLVCNISTCQCSPPGQGVCGDGIINTPNSSNINEQCDDGNTISGDGCSSTCQSEIEGVGAACDGNASNNTCDPNNSICANQLYCDNTSCTCQPLTASPVTVISASPSGSNVCRNAVVIITFNQAMNKESFANNIILGKATAEGLGAIVKGTITSYEQLVGQNIQTVVTFTPDDLLNPSTIYQGIIKNGQSGVRGKGGGMMASVFNALVFTTGATVCKIDKIDISIAPPGTKKKNDLFLCAGKNNCSGDQNSAMLGNQHQYTAEAFNVMGNVSTPLAAKYYWSQESKPAGLIAISSSPKTGLANPYFTPQNKNGQAIITVTAVGDGVNNVANTKDAQVTADNFLCGNPWPSISEFPYQDATTNFSTFYCRDAEVLLPDFNRNVVPGSGDLLREFFFAGDVFKAEKNIEAKNGTDYSNDFTCDCASQSVSMTGCCHIAQWEYQFNFPEEGDYQVYIETNNDQDLSAFGIHHNIVVSLDGVVKGAIKNLAVPQHQTGYLALKNVTAGAHTIRYDWDNDWYIAGIGDSNLKIYKVGLEKGSAARDVIGVRVMKNDQKLDPLAWYQENVPNPGSVSALTVDGYEAVRSGRTVYVNAANVSGGTVYANIYLISYNEGASSETIDIFNQMLKNWHFNTNISDFLIKGELSRDLVRWGDEKEIEKLLENYKASHGYYPKLESGSYIKGVTTSKWPSWQATLSKELGRTLPIDPINEFGDCAGYNPETCWNEASKTFAGSIPDNVPQGTDVYFYRSLNEGQNYDLDTQEEYGKGCLSNQCEENGVCYPQGVSCHPTQSLVYCQQGVWKSSWKSSCGNNVTGCGELCDNNFRNYCDLQFGANGWHEPKFQSCLPAGSVNQCKWNLQEVYAIGDCGGYCGDNAKNGQEECDNETRNYCDTVLGNHNWYSEPKNQNCSSQCQWNPSQTYTAADCGGYCGDNATNGSEQCDGNSRNYCDAVLGNHNWYSEPKNQSCLPPFWSGNIFQILSGNINPCHWNPYQTYTPADCGGYCGDAIVSSAHSEECEQAGTGASVNNQYACTNCKWSGGWCGNGQVDSVYGEQCEQAGTGASINNQYGCTNCKWSGGWCGDGAKNGTEECDGTLCCTASCQQETALTQYVLGNTTVANHQGQGGCGQDTYKTCPSGYTRVINYGNILGVCCWAGDLSLCSTWGGQGYGLPYYAFPMYSSSCVPNNQCAPYYCGDNEIEGPEQCDSGPQNGQVCNAPYGGSCQYCSNSCANVTIAGAYCGDGQVDLVFGEQCEQAGTGTSINNQYGCTNCKWSGGYCGDGTKNGSEQCDGTLCCVNCQQKAVLASYNLGNTSENDRRGKGACDQNSYKECQSGYTRVINFNNEVGTCCWSYLPWYLGGGCLHQNYIYTATCVPNNQCAP